MPSVSLSVKWEYGSAYLIEALGSLSKVMHKTRINPEYSDFSSAIISRIKEWEVEKAHEGDHGLVEANKVLSLTECAAGKVTQLLFLQQLLYVWEALRPRPLSQSLSQPSVKFLGYFLTESHSFLTNSHFQLVFKLDVFPQTHRRFFQECVFAKFDLEFSISLFFQIKNSTCRAAG